MKTLLLQGAEVEGSKGASEIQDIMTAYVDVRCYWRQRRVGVIGSVEPSIRSDHQ